MSAMGIKIADFDVPVCNSFQAKIINDQLCYEVDLNRFSNNDNIENELRVGFIFLMDYNEDRQSFDPDNRTVEHKSFASRLVRSDNKKHASIIINTIGNISQILYHWTKNNLFRACQTYGWRGVQSKWSEGNYNNSFF